MSSTFPQQFPAHFLCLASAPKSEQKKQRLRSVFRSIVTYKTSSHPSIHSRPFAQHCNPRSHHPLHIRCPSHPFAVAALAEIIRIVIQMIKGPDITLQTPKNLQNPREHPIKIMSKICVRPLLPLKCS